MASGWQESGLVLVLDSGGWGACSELCQYNTINVGLRFDAHSMRLPLLRWLPVQLPMRRVGPLISPHPHVPPTSTHISRTHTGRLGFCSHVQRMPLYIGSSSLHSLARVLCSIFSILLACSLYSPVLGVPIRQSTRRQLGPGHTCVWPFAWHT